ncbi:RNA recognition motif domain-containing protein [Desulfofustis limnaeus]|uniref:RNA-binding protein n=1 Tax=Desulfofustis limnaeus TaxID=2740163 RepID=A0ABN6M142_9BACT|nr:RNA-binding protein [Desulfofustis limnaeus]MDX9896166.1 RNA-binding protein [Desulfofustis sp.]BDD86617.1 RNA-binding protein [Desulfofustis limnaeus]
MKLFIGNLPYDINETDLRGMLTPHGEVVEMNLVLDQFTGRPKGFAFVEMADRSGGQQAMEDLNKRVYKSRQLVCNEAKPKKKTRGRR